MINVKLRYYVNQLKQAGILSDKNEAAVLFERLWLCELKYLAILLKWFANLYKINS